MARTPALPEATLVGALAALRGSSRPPADRLRGRRRDLHFRHTNLRPNGARQTPNMPFQRLEKNTCGVPEEKLSLPDVARKHGVRGVAGLLPDLESGDARPSSARRKAGA